MSKRKGNNIIAGRVTIIDTSGFATKTEVAEKVDKTDVTITKQGNDFNVANSLVKIDENNKLPILDGSQLTNISSKISNTVNDGNTNILGVEDLLTMYTFNNNIPWVQPILTSNTSYGVVTASSNYAGYDPYRAADGVKSGTAVSFAFASGSTGWWNWALPYPIKISQINFYNRESTPLNQTWVYRIWTDSSKTIPLSGVTMAIQTPYGMNTINLQTPVITNNIYVEIISGGSTCGIGELEITAHQPDVVYPTSVSFKTGDGTVGNFKPTLITYANNSQEILTIIASITGLFLNGSYAIIKEKGADPLAIPIPMNGKDLWVDFSQGNATDNYGLHTPTIYGTPTFIDGKFKSNGATSIAYPTITTMGTGAWCIQGKYNFPTTSVSNVLSQYTDANYGIILNKNVTTGTLILYLGGAGNATWNIASGILGTKVFTDALIEYYIRLRFTGTQYLVDWSTDYNPLTMIGNWTNDITINSSVLVSNSNTPLRFGAYVTGTTNPHIGTMDDLQVTIGQPTCQIKNTVTMGKTLPIYPKAGDYHCISTPSGQQTYKYIVGWNSNQFVQLGTSLTANNFVSSVSTNKYNQNGVIVDINTTGALTKFWVSAEYTFATGVGINIIHNLNLSTDGSYIVVPMLICKTAVEGYSVGDEIQGVFDLYANGNTETASPVVSSNSIFQPVGNSYSFFVSNKTGTSYMAAVNVPAYFRYKVKIFYS